MINNGLCILYSILPENKKWIYYITGLQRRLFAVERTNASVLCICFVIFEKKFTFDICGCAIVL